MKDETVMPGSGCKEGNHEHDCSCAGLYSAIEYLTSENFFTASNYPSLQEKLQSLKQ